MKQVVQACNEKSIIHNTSNQCTLVAPSRKWRTIRKFLKNFNQIGKKCAIKKKLLFFFPSLFLYLFLHLRMKYANQLSVYEGSFLSICKDKMSVYIR